MRTRTLAAALAVALAATHAAAQEKAPDGVLLARGDAARSGKGGTLPEKVRQQWQRATILDKLDETGDVDRGKEAEQWLGQALAKPVAGNDPLLPGAVPLVLNDLVIYRTYNGLTATRLTDLKDKAGKVEAKAGSIEWKSTEFDGALATILSDVGTRPAVDLWLQNGYRRANSTDLLYENTATGSLSSDGRLVYAVDTLAVPAPPSALQPKAGKVGKKGEKPAPVDDRALRLVNSGALVAFDAKVGKLVLRLGDGPRNDDFSDSQFLGPPLPLGGRLYALNEHNDGRLRLFC